MPMHVTEARVGRFSTVYWFADGRCWENPRDPYAAILTIEWIDDRTVRLSGLLGEMTRERRRELNDYLIACGIQDALMQRHGVQVARHADIQSGPLAEQATS